MELIINLPSAFGIPLLLLVLPVAPAISVSPSLLPPPLQKLDRRQFNLLPLFFFFSPHPPFPLPSFSQVPQFLFLSPPPLPSLLCYSISVRVGETRYRERRRRGEAERSFFALTLDFLFFEASFSCCGLSLSSYTHIFCL